MIHTEQDGDVTIVTIDRPERRNAVDHDALSGLHDAITRSSGRVLVLTGVDGHFCAGADLQGVEDEAFADQLGRLLLALRSDPRPSIAAVEGAALGAGTQLAIACDLRTATADALFGIPAARLGLMVDEWTLRRLVSIVGQGTASALLLAAERLTGDQAATLGLVQRVASRDEGVGWAHDLARLAPLTIAGHKLGLRLIEHDAQLDPADRAAYLEAFGAAWRSEDLQEGLASFRERRPPVFRGH